MVSYVEPFIAPVVRRKVPPDGRNKLRPYVKTHITNREEFSFNTLPAPFEGARPG